MGSREAHSSRDAAGVGPYQRPGVHLVPMRKLGDWKVVDGDVDVRGWEVRTVSGSKIGTVQELLVDQNAGEVVMLDVDLENSDRHALAPIRAVQIDRTARVVRIDSADIEGGVPSLARRGATEDDAREFGDRYGRAYGRRGWRDDRDYVVQRDEDDVHFGRRAEAAAEGGAGAAIDRAPPPPMPEAPDASTSDRQRTVRYLADDGVEETVVETRPVVVEEVIVRRRVVGGDAGRAGGAGDPRGADPER